MADPEIAGQSALSTGAVVLEPVAQTTPTAPITETPASTPTWFDGLPEGLRANPTLQNFKSKDVSALAESLVNAEKLVGGSVRLPNDKDTPADRAAKLDKIFTQLGRPPTAAEYKLLAPDAAAGIPWDEKTATQFKEVAHKLGLTQAQAEGLAQFDIQRAMSNQVDSTAAFNDCIATLEKDWGAASKQMLGLSRRTAATYFDPETMAVLESSGVANNPKFVKALASMGKELMEEGLIIGGREGMAEDGGMSHLQQELDRTMQDPKSAYWDSQNPNHDATVVRMESLRRALLEMTPSVR